MRGEAPEKRQAKPAQAWHRAVPGAETGARQQRHLTSERVALRQCATAHPGGEGERERTPRRVGATAKNTLWRGVFYPRCQ